LRRGILLDLVMYLWLIVAAVLSGSLTVLAELPRATLLFSVEIIAYITLVQSNSGRLFAFEYGIGKIERVITVVIAGGLFLSAFYIIGQAIDRLQHPTILPTPALVLAVTFSAANLLENAYFTGEFIRSNASEQSLIIETQIHSRMVKTMSSLVVVLVLVAAACLSDPKGVVMLDAVGAVFIAGYMVYTGTEMMRESLPDVLDRALPEDQQLIIMRTIAQNFDHFEQFGEIRSRRSGGEAFISLRLMFDPEMSLMQVNGVCARIKAQLEDAIPGSEVSVMPDVHLRGE